MFRICVYVTLNSVRREIVSALTIVSYDKVRGQNNSGGFKGGLWGLQPPPPRRISQAHILTYAFQG